MKYTELTIKAEADLKKDLKSLMEKRENLRMKIKLGQVKNVHELTLVRRDIARILTFLNK